MALGIGVRHLRPVDLLHLVEQRGVRGHRPTQRYPVIPVPAGDQVADSGQGQALVVQMAVFYGGYLVEGSRIRCLAVVYSSTVPCGRRLGAGAGAAASPSCHARIGYRFRGKLNRCGPSSNRSGQAGRPHASSGLAAAGASSTACSGTTSPPKIPAPPARRSGVQPCIRTEQGKKPASIVPETWTARDQHGSEEIEQRITIDVHPSQGNCRPDRPTVLGRGRGGWHHFQAAGRPTIDPVGSALKGTGDRQPPRPVRLGKISPNLECGPKCCRRRRP